MATSERALMASRPIARFLSGAVATWLTASRLLWLRWSAPRIPTRSMGARHEPAPQNGAADRGSRRTSASAPPYDGAAGLLPPRFSTSRQKRPLVLSGRIESAGSGAARGHDPLGTHRRPV